jgi:predicted CoA-binding protein
MPELTTEAEIRETLLRARTIAVLGAHEKPSRPAFYVPDYLHRQGYRIIPVNPALAGQTLWGEVVRGELAGIGEPVDIVDVFRRPEALAAHEPDILAMKPRPRVVWLQLGIRSDVFARAMLAAGIDVVQDRCTLADHRRMGLGPVDGGARNGGGFM